MGPVEQVCAFSDTLGHERIEVEDTAVAAVRFANGAMGVIEGATTVHPGFFKRIEISGTGGSAVLEEESITTWDFVEADAGDDAIREKFGGQGESGGGASDPGAIDFRPHATQIGNFVEALAGKTELLIDAKEGRKSVAIILAIYESAKTAQSRQGFHRVSGNKGRRTLFKTPDVLNNATIRERSWPHLLRPCSFPPTLLSQKFVCICP